MQLTGILCYALLTITLTATLSHAETEANNNIERKKMDRRMNRRTNTVIVDGAIDRVAPSSTTVIHKRVTKKRYSPSKATYRPSRPKYRPPPKSIRNPIKKHKNSHGSSYHPSSYKKRNPKPRYSPQQRHRIKYGRPKPNYYQSLYPKENVGFGEPPSKVPSINRPYNNKKPTQFKNTVQHNFHDDEGIDVDDFPTKKDEEDSFSSKPKIAQGFAPRPISTYFSNDDFPQKHFDEFQNVKIGQGYAEPPVDSYGVPVKSNLQDLTYPAHSSVTAGFTEEDYNNFEPEWHNFKNHNSDNSISNSKTHPTFIKPDSNVFVIPIPRDNEEQSLNSYSDIFSHRQTIHKNKVNNHKTIKIMNRPWKGSKLKEIESTDEVVGGQYAEPPARYFSKFQPSAAMYSGDESVFSQPLGLSNPDVGSLGSISSYVNYKNSNMAFSPQNLNDAFGIVD